MSKVSSTGKRSATSTIKHHAEELRGLPEPGEARPYDELPEWISRARLHSLVHEGILRRVTREQTSTGYHRGLYTTDEDCWELLNEIWNQKTPQKPPYLPCGHSGFHNEGDGRYSCTTYCCEAEFDREELEAFWEGGE